MNNILKKIKLGFKNDKKGMTLIELMVVVAIFLVLTGIVIFDHNSFRSVVSLDNLASDIALSIRKAQSYAIGVRGSSSSFEEGYGVSFVKVEDSDNDNLLFGSNRSFIIFKDLNNNKKYDIPDSSEVCGSLTLENECKEILNITSLDKISEIYYVSTNENKKEITSNGRIDVVFKRPNPDSYFCYRTDGENSDCVTDSNFLYIIVEISNDKNKRYVTIWNTGQISMDTEDVSTYKRTIIPE
jgi:prepilin-type N-terminal cleavage/methylation domain-containing protein